MEKRQAAIEKWAADPGVRLTALRRDAVHSAEKCRLAPAGMRFLTVVVAVVVSCLIGHNASRGAASSSTVWRKVADIPLPGRATRFDYQSLDPHTGRLYLSHMGDGAVVVFDVKQQRVVVDLPGFPGVTGVLAVPELGRVFASVTGKHQVAVIDEKTLHTVARTPGGRFPDGIAYDPVDRKLFVSDEMGRAETVIDARANRRIATIPMGGEVGNTQYDPASHRIFANVQTRSQVVTIDPQTNRIVARYPLPGGRHPHGLLIDAGRRLAFAACEGDAHLLVLDMHTMRVTSVQQVGSDPDVLAFDPALRRLYVACESGVVSIFDEQEQALVKRGDIYVAREAHTVSVDPQTHQVYLPLQNVNGRPVLRIMAPILPHASGKVGPSEQGESIFSGQPASRALPRPTCTSDHLDDRAFSGRVR